MSHDQMIKARSLLSEAADFIDKIRVGVTVKARSGMVAKLRAFVAGDTGPRCEIVASRTDKLPRWKPHVTITRHVREANEATTE